VTMLSCHREAEPAALESTCSYAREFQKADIQEEKPFPEKAVIITFDDGYKDNFTRAYRSSC
jgi:peptidoglycan/xylan/chitin deacetylase (PgdA/CDA1 family)